MITQAHVQAQLDSIVALLAWEAEHVKLESMYFVQFRFKSKTPGIKRPAKIKA